MQLASSKQSLDLGLLPFFSTLFPKFHPAPPCICAMHAINLHAYILHIDLYLTPLHIVFMSDVKKGGKLFLFAMLLDIKRKINVLTPYCVLSWKRSRFSGYIQDQTQESIGSDDIVKCIGGGWYISQLLL